MFFIIALYTNAQSCTDLLKQLTNGDPKIALTAYIKLTQSNPDKVDNVLKKHIEEDLEANDVLPSFWEQFLPQQARLTDYCNKNGFSYTPTDTIQAYLNLLNSSIPFSKRYKAENELIEHMKLKDVTAIEYWGTLYCDRRGQPFGLPDTLSVSIARVLDIFYSKHWTEVTHNKQQLRLYLKKSYLLSNMGIIGVCNNYLVKFSTSSKTFVDTLSNMISWEKDNDIKGQLKRLVNGKYVELDYSEYKELNRHGGTIPLKDFLHNLKSYSYDLADNVIIDTTGSDYSVMADKILSLKNADDINKIFRAITSHPSANMVGPLLRLVNDSFAISSESITYDFMGGGSSHVTHYITVSDVAINAISVFYNFWFPAAKKGIPIDIKAGMDESAANDFSFDGPDEYKQRLTAPYWLELWKVDSADHANWGRMLYHEKLDIARRKDTINANDLNMLWKSKFYTAADRPAIIYMFSKVMPYYYEDIHPKMGDFISPAELTYFDKVKMDKSYELERIMEHILPQEDARVMHFAKRQCGYMDFKEKSKAFMLLGKYTDYYSLWGDSLIKDTAWRKYITQTLEIYRETLEYNDEIADADAVIMELNNKSLPSFTARICAIDPGKYKEYRNVIGVDIEALPYDSLGSLFTLYNKGFIQEGMLEEYLINDMGFLLPNERKETLDEFISNYYKMSEKDLYANYLDKAGIIYKKPNGELDLQKIYSMLKWDDVKAAFVGSTNGAGGEQLPSLSRILELTFHTTLGQEKLFNHYLTGRGGSSDYATAWRKYLENNKLVVQDNYEVPSFSKGD